MFQGSAGISLLVDESLFLLTISKGTAVSISLKECILPNIIFQRDLLVFQGSMLVRAPFSINHQKDEVVETSIQPNEQVYGQVNQYPETLV